MKIENLSRLSTQEFVVLFVEKSLEHYIALDQCDTSSSNRKIFSYILEIEKELKSRPGDQRSELLPL